MFAAKWKLTPLNTVCGADWPWNDPYCKVEPKHVQGLTSTCPLVTKNWNLSFRIHLSVEVESFYFKFLLTEFIDYEHVRSSSSAGDQNHVRTIVNVRSLEQFLNQGGIFQQKPAESSCRWDNNFIFWSNACTYSNGRYRMRSEQKPLLDNISISPTQEGYFDTLSHWTQIGRMRSPDDIIMRRE